MNKGSLNKILRVHFRREAYFPGERGYLVILKKQKEFGRGKSQEQKQERIVKSPPIKSHRVKEKAEKIGME